MEVKNILRTTVASIAFFNAKGVIDQDWDFKDQMYDKHKDNLVRMARVYKYLKEKKLINSDSQSINMKDIGKLFNTDGTIKDDYDDLREIIKYDIMDKARSSINLGLESEELPKSKISLVKEVNVNEVGQVEDIKNNDIDKGRANNINIEYISAKNKNLSSNINKYSKKTNYIYTGNLAEEMPRTSYIDAGKLSDKRSSKIILWINALS